jgi:hypothetical protein
MEIVILLIFMIFLALIQFMHVGPTPLGNGKGRGRWERVRL